MVNYKKILGQTSSFTERRWGQYEGPVYRVVRTETTPADMVFGTQSVYSEVSTEIRCDMHPFLNTRWGEGVSEKFADWILMSHEELNYDEANDRSNDEIEYKDVRYRIVGVRHHNRLAFDDMWQYAIRRYRNSSGGVA